MQDTSIWSNTSEMTFAEARVWNILEEYELTRSCGFSESPIYHSTPGTIRRPRCISTSSSDGSEYSSNDASSRYEDHVAKVLRFSCDSHLQHQDTIPSCYNSNDISAVLSDKSQIGSNTISWVQSSHTDNTLRISLESQHATRPHILKKLDSNCELNMKKLLSHKVTPYPMRCQQPTALTKSRDSNKFCSSHHKDNSPELSYSSQERIVQCSSTNIKSIDNCDGTEDISPDSGRAQNKRKTLCKISKVLKNVTRKLKKLQSKSKKSEACKITSL